MQFIKKLVTQPADWDYWFTTTTNRRTYDYASDYSDLHHLRAAKHFLINEQNGCCAYCGQGISLDGSSIEHVVPKELNVSLSTDYHNLVAVCKKPVKDPETGKDHCDKEKGSRVITPFIFFADSDVTDKKGNTYFKSKSDGSIEANTNTTLSNWYQAQAFIEVLNLNHSLLRQNRAKDMLAGLLSAYIACPKGQKGIFWKVQFEHILKNKKIPYRQFLLNYIAGKIGVN